MRVTLSYLKKKEKGYIKLNYVFCLSDTGSSCHVTVMGVTDRVCIQKSNTIHVQYNINLLLSNMMPNIEQNNEVSELHTFYFILIGLIGFTTKKEGQYDK